jgi:hypothetical protein
MLAPTSLRNASGAGAHCRHIASVRPATPEPPPAVMAPGSKPDAAISCAANRGGVSIGHESAAVLMACS